MQCFFLTSNNNNVMKVEIRKYKRKIISNIGPALIGNDCTNVLIDFLAFQTVSHSLILFGHLFQTLLASLRKVDWTREVFPNSFRLPFATALVRQLEFPCTTFSTFNGWLVSFKAFQTSVIFIWAFSWFTDSMLTFDSNVFVLILSSNLLPFKSLIPNDGQNIQQLLKFEFLNYFF